MAATACPPLAITLALGFGEDAEGKLDVMTTANRGPAGTTGRVLRIVGGERERHPPHRTTRADSDSPCPHPVFRVPTPVGRVAFSSKEPFHGGFNLPAMF